MNQPKPSSSTMPLGSDPSTQGQAGPSGTIVNPAAQEAPQGFGYDPAAPQGYAPNPAAQPGYGHNPAGQAGHGPAGHGPAGHGQAGHGQAGHGQAGHGQAGPQGYGGQHGYAPVPTPAPASSGYSPYPGVAMPAGYPPTTAQQQPPGASPQGAAGRADRGDELASEGPRTVYEFSGAAAGSTGGDKRTFVGGLDNMSDIGARDRSERSSNLKGGASSWVLIFLGVAVVGGGLAFLSMTKGDKAEPPVETPAVAAEPGADPAAPAAETAGASAAAPDPAAAKAEEEAKAKAEEEAKAKAKAEEEAKAKKKKATTKKKTVKKRPSAPKPDPEPEPDKPTRLTPKKPPRDDGFGGLPKPP